MYKDCIANDMEQHTIRQFSALGQLEIINAPMDDSVSNLRARPTLNRFQYYLSILIHTYTFLEIQKH